MADSELVAGDVFDLERIRRLVELMKEQDLTEIDLRQAEQQIRIARGGSEVRTYTVPAVAAAPSATAPLAAAPAEAESKSIVYITSPMVGTFYCRPNPNAESFVKVGEHIESEKTICIIEAMKVFNEIPAEVRGKVLAILVEDEEPVEFGKPLFKIDTSG